MFLQITKKLSKIAENIKRKVRYKKVQKICVRQNVYYPMENVELLRA